MATIDDLSARLGALEEELRAVKARLEAEADRRRGLMRDARRCPACGGQKILRVERVQCAGSPVAVFTNLWTGKSVGEFEAFVCAGCGHAELQVDDPSLVEGKPKVSALEPAGGRGPYR